MLLHVTHTGCIFLSVVVKVVKLRLGLASSTKIGGCDRVMRVVWVGQYGVRAQPSKLTRSSGQAEIKNVVRWASVTSRISRKGFRLLRSLLCSKRLLTAETRTVGHKGEACRDWSNRLHVNISRLSRGHAALHKDSLATKPSTRKD